MKEYLVRNKMVSTLQHFREESHDVPMTRLHLIESLSLQGLVTHNSKSDPKLNTLLDMLVSYLSGKSSSPPPALPLQQSVVIPASLQESLVSRPVKEASPVE